MWSTLHSRRPRQYPAENKSRLKNMERKRKDNQEMDSVVKAIPTRILSRERARLRSRASLALKICKSSLLASSGER